MDPSLFSVSRFSSLPPPFLRLSYRLPTGERSRASFFLLDNLVPSVLSLSPRGPSRRGPWERGCLLE